MRNPDFFSILLSGGTGTRFAPLSTPDKPKQFLHVLSREQTMLQETAGRIASICDPQNIFVSTNESFAGLITEQLRDIPKTNIIAEPFKKNTAPPIALISHYIHLLNEKAVLLFLPSDHFIKDTERAQKLFSQALHFAANHDDLITFGIPPEFPSSDYGYICFEQQKDEVKHVKKFVEKPDEVTAKKYINEGCYYWNSGMFVWRASIIMEAVKNYLPAMYQLLQDHFKTSADILDIKKMRSYFEAVESISIDYGIMEKASNVKMFPFDAGWSDVGTWKGLDQLQKKYVLSLPDEVSFYLQKYRDGQFS